MNLTGIPVSRWIDGVLEDPANMDNPDKVRAMVLWGHAPNSQTRMKEMKTAMEKLDMLVVIDPYPTVSAVLHDRTDGVYLPASTQFETRGSVTASNRSIQWRDQVVDPLFESLPDHIIMAKLANKFGWADRFFAILKWKTRKRQISKASYVRSTPVCGPLGTRVKTLRGSNSIWQTSIRLIVPHCRLLVALLMGILRSALAIMGHP